MGLGMQFNYVSIGILPNGLLDLLSFAFLKKNT